MHTLAYWLPGPWELAVCSVLALFAMAAVGALVVIAVVLASRHAKSRPPQAPPPHDASPPPDGAPPSEPSES